MLKLLNKRWQHTTTYFLLNQSILEAAGRKTVTPTDALADYATVTIISGAISSRSSTCSRRGPRKALTQTIEEGATGITVA